MRKLTDTLIQSIIDHLAPYTVTNAQFGKVHRCWSWKSALEWMACYDAKEYGPTTLTGLKGVLIARKFA